MYHICRRRAATLPPALLPWHMQATELAEQMAAYLQASWAWPVGGLNGKSWGRSGTKVRHHCSVPAASKTCNYNPSPQNPAAQVLGQPHPLIVPARLQLPGKVFGPSGGAAAGEGAASTSSCVWLSGVLASATEEQLMEAFAQFGFPQKVCWVGCAWQHCDVARHLHLSTMVLRSPGCCAPCHAALAPTQTRTPLSSHISTLIQARCQNKRTPAAPRCRLLQAHLVRDPVTGKPSSHAVLWMESNQRARDLMQVRAWWLPCCSGL